MSSKRSTERGPGSNQYGDKPPLPPKPDELKDRKAKSAQVKTNLQLLVDQEDFFDESERQRILLEEQNALNIMWLSPRDRHAVEEAMMQFDQAANPSDQKLALEQLRATTAAANEVAEQRYRNSVEAQIMLNELGNPITEEGVRLANTLHNVAAGTTDLEPALKDKFEEVRSGEIQHVRSREALSEASVFIRRGMDSTEELSRQARALYDYPPERVFPRLKMAAEETAGAMRRFRMALEGTDGETSTRLDPLAHEASSQLRRLEEEIEFMQRNFHRNGKVDADAVGSITLRIRRATEAVGELKRLTRLTLDR